MKKKRKERIKWCWSRMVTSWKAICSFKCVEASYCSWLWPFKEKWRIVFPWQDDPNQGRAAEIVHVSSPVITPLVPFIFTDCYSRWISVALCSILPTPRYTGRSGCMCHGSAVKISVFIWVRSRSLFNVIPPACSDKDRPTSCLTSVSSQTTGWKVCRTVREFFGRVCYKHCWYYTVMQNGTQVESSLANTSDIFASCRIRPLWGRRRTASPNTVGYIKATWTVPSALPWGWDRHPLINYLSSAYIVYSQSIHRLCMIIDHK